MEIYCGTVEGTGASINIACGFLPSWVDLFNIDGDCFLHWTKDMAAGTGYKVIAAGTNALIDTLGITSATHSNGTVGFVIGADTDINVSAETICWKAGH